RDDVAGDLALAVDAIGVDLLHQAREPIEKRLGASDFGGILVGIGMDEVEAQRAEKQVADEAGRGPLRLARCFRDVARFGGTDGAPGFGGGGHAENLTALTVPRSEGDCGSLRRRYFHAPFHVAQRGPRAPRVPPRGPGRAATAARAPAPAHP